MKPKLFKEYVDHSSQISPPFVSLRDYKIIYTQPLGSGVFGKVYALAIRPDEEKGFLSTLFPYIYDRFYLAKNIQLSGYCVKISRSFLEIALNEIRRGNDLFLARPVDSFWERSTQMQSNQLRVTYGISQITSYPTNSWYSQVKTRVVGKTFRECIITGEFLNEENYIMRKSFIVFLWAIVSTPLELDDVHSENIMFDTKQQRWEIVDGHAEEGNYHKRDDRKNLQDSIIFSLLAFLPNESKINDSKSLVRKLARLALENYEYTENIDQKILMQSTMRNYTEFHFFDARKQSDGCINIICETNSINKSKCSL